MRRKSVGLFRLNPKDILPLDFQGFRQRLSIIIYPYLYRLLSVFNYRHDMGNKEQTPIQKANRLSGNRIMRFDGTDQRLDAWLCIDG